MEFAPLIENDKSQSYLMYETKFLVEETLTTIMEILMAKKVDRWSKEEIEKLEKYRSFPGKEFYQYRDTDNKAVIEYSDAISLMIKFFTSKKSYGSDVKNMIVKSQKELENEDFIEKKFRQEFDNQFDKETAILERLRNIRNREHGHATARSNMGEIYKWISELEDYLDCFRFRLKLLSEFDKNFWKTADLKQLDACQEKIDILKDQCFDSDENSIIYRFGKNKYKVTSKDKKSFERLLNDMAEDWGKGIQYLRAENVNNQFHAIIEASIENYDIVLEFDRKFDEFKKTQEGSMEEAILYMTLLYTIYPSIQGFYWKGKWYSESSFASKVLHVITRHPEAFSLDKKIETLNYRINKLSEWNETNERQRGIGIDIRLLCREHVLSMYFKKRNDERGDLLAKLFEDVILEANTSEQVVEKYDEIIIKTLDLASFMKGGVTYALPFADRTDDEKPVFKVFRNPDEFRQYFIGYINKAQGIDDVAKFVNMIKDDNNFKYFFDNYDSYVEKES